MFSKNIIIKLTMVSNGILEVSMIVSNLTLLSGIWRRYYTMSLAERGGQLSKPFDDFASKAPPILKPYGCQIHFIGEICQHSITK
jgi:hypothetical protein